MSRPRKDVRKGTTVPELSFERIWFTPEQIEAARRMAPADLHDVLGLLPEQSEWYYDTDGTEEGHREQGHDAPAVPHLRADDREM